jgi:hypothetical protein
MLHRKNMMPRFTKITSTLILSLMFLLVGCEFLRGSEDCNLQGEVYLALLNNGEKWSRHFSASASPSSSDYIFFNANNRRYAVQFLLYQYSHTQPVLFVSIKNGWPATEFGIVGYLYTVDGELSYQDSEFEFERMSDHIFCYRQREDLT